MRCLVCRSKGSELLYPKQSPYQLQFPIGPSVSHLMRQMQIFKKATSAKSTCYVYDIGVDKYYIFCKELHVSSFPLSEVTLCLFASDLAGYVSISTVKLCISALKHKNIELGYKNTFPKMTQLHLTLCGIKHGLGNHGTQTPPTVTLKLFKQYLVELRLFHYDRLMYWAAFTSASFGFLRSSEYISLRSLFYQTHHPAMRICGVKK